jgi:alpha-beta hydrolase superfamily lysophospholipase
MSHAHAQCAADESASSSHSNQREMIRLMQDGQPTLALQAQRPQCAVAGGDVVYVHGSTFGADLSIFFRLDGHSWADEMNAAGFTVWGFDFAGYGGSERYAPDSDRPVGRIDEVVTQLRRVVQAVRERNGGQAVALVAHSWGATVAAHYAGLYPHDVKALVLFAPIVTRHTAAFQASAYLSTASIEESTHYPLNLWMQYRRFIDDVPRGEPQVLAEQHFQAWGEAFLATDNAAQSRTPPAVKTPRGPQMDVAALWSGQTLFDAAKISAPMLVVRGGWDTVFTEMEAIRLAEAVSSTDKSLVNIERATHLMHLESQRGVLYNGVNSFLLKSTT